MRKILFGLLFSCSVYGGLQTDINRASRILYEFKRIPEQSIPREVLNNAQGLAVMTVLKGGFIFSGRIGSGLVIARTSEGWSAPSAIGMGGAGFGFQIGGEITDFILVLNTQAAVDAFSRGGNVTIGGNLSVAAGPIGRSVEGSLVLPLAAVYSYSRSKGAFAGISLEGTVILERSKANTQFYGRYVTPRELLSGEIPPPKSAEELYKQL